MQAACRLTTKQQVALSEIVHVFIRRHCDNVRRQRILINAVGDATRSQVCTTPQPDLSEFAMKKWS